MYQDPTIAALNFFLFAAGFALLIFALAALVRAVMWFTSPKK